MLPPTTAATMEKLPPELAAEVASRVSKAAADPMEDLASLWPSCSQIRRAYSDAYVGQSIPLEPVMQRAG